MKTLRYFLTVCLFMGIYAFSFGQTPTATETTAKFLKKESGNALVITVQGQPKNVREVLTESLKNETGSKPKLKLASSMTSFLGVTFNKISSDQMDYHFKVEKAGKSDNNSQVTFFVSAGNNNFLTSADYPSEMRNAREYLAGLEFEVKKYELQLTIDEQGKVLEKSIKDHQNMIQDSIKLEQRLADAKQAIIDNKTSRANQLIKIDDNRAKLEDLKYELDVMNGNAEVRARDREEVRPEYRRDDRRDDDRYREEDRYRNDDRAERDSRYRDDELRAKSASQSRYDDRGTDTYRSETSDRYEERERRYEEDDRYRRERDDRRYEDDRREDDRYREEERRYDDRDDRYRSEERRYEDDRRYEERDDRYREEDRRAEEERRILEEKYRELDRWYGEEEYREDNRRFRDVEDTRTLTDREYERYKAWKLYGQRLREEEDRRRSRYDDSRY